MEFKNRIVMIGYGVVAQALLPMLVKHLRVPCAKIVVVDRQHPPAREVPHREILEVAQPRLGRITSVCSNWTPLSRHCVYFEKRAETQVDKSDAWQFRNFLFRP